MENDSDKENQDPALKKNILETPPSKKRISRKKHRSTQSLVVTQLHEPLLLSEGVFVFGKTSRLPWMPGKIVQIENPYNVVCYWFCDNNITMLSKGQLCSFLNYGSKVDFGLLRSDQEYRKGIIAALSGFADMYRPDLLQHKDVEDMLLDWARLGFIGCSLVQKRSDINHRTNIQVKHDIPNVTDDGRPGPSNYIEHTPKAIRRPSEMSQQSFLNSAVSRKRRLSHGTEDSGYTSPNRSSPSLNSPSSSSSSSESRRSEIGMFVLGKLTRYGWWPGRIAESHKSHVFCKPNQRLIYWLGDCTRSVVDIKDIAPITKFPEVYQKSKKGLYRVALYDFLSDAAISCGYNEVELPECVNIDEKALENLVQWACNDFKPTGPPEIWAPSTFYHEMSYQKNTKSESVKNLDINDKDPIVSSSRRGVCVACIDRMSSHDHPLFEEDLCTPCYEDFAQYAFVFGDDGTGNFCSICCRGGSMFICDEQQCGRAYCRGCITRVCGSDILYLVEDTEPWFCLLCTETDVLGRLTRRCDWQKRLQDMISLPREGEGQYDTPLPPPVPHLSIRKPMRVLSLFDGIATGLVALKNIGFQMETYVSSEVDEDSINVIKIHHPNVVHIGDVTKLTPTKILDLGEFDMVIGGSPCNDLSTVNPARKGIYEGTGRLFFEFYRILNYVKQSSPNVFWLFENVVSMRQADKCIISRFLQNNPFVIDAKHVSCMNRARYFWGNLPGMRRPVVPVETDKLLLQSCLEKHCDRVARFDKIKCITTKSTSVKQSGGRTLPVMIGGDKNGTGDWLWCTEMERVFGLPPHYTDVANMSRHSRQKLLGKAWSVPVLRHLFEPLRDYFKLANDKTSKS